MTAFLDQLLPHAMSTTTSPPISRPSSTTSRPATRTTRTCWPGSGAISPPPSPRPPICASARCWKRSTSSWRRTSYPPRADGSDPRLCQICGNGPAAPEDRALGRRLHRLLELSRMPLHPPVSAGERGRRRGSADGQVLGQDDERPAGHAARSAASAPMSSAARPTEEAPKPPRASLPKGWTPETHDAGTRAAAARPAAPDRPAPRGRRAGRGRDRPLRPLREARHDLRQPPRRRGGLHHRHEPRGRGSGAEGDARRAARRRGEAAARAGRCIPTAARCRSMPGATGPT